MPPRCRKLRGETLEYQQITPAATTYSIPFLLSRPGQAFLPIASSGRPSSQSWIGRPSKRTLGNKLGDARSVTGERRFSSSLAICARTRSSALRGRGSASPVISTGSDIALIPLTVGCPSWIVNVHTIRFPSLRQLLLLRPSAPLSSPPNPSRLFGVPQCVRSSLAPH